MEKFQYIPKELLNIILEYDGRIKYKNGKYVNTIHKNDERYNIIQPIISKKLKKIIAKLKFMKTMEQLPLEEVYFTGINGRLCGNYNFSYWNNKLIN